MTLNLVTYGNIHLGAIRVSFCSGQEVLVHLPLTDLWRDLSRIQILLKDHDEQIEAIFGAIRRLITLPETPPRKIGFEVKEKRAAYGKKGKGVSG